ncbi:MAG: hypothetical protein AAF514_09065 [Verrucomicrobiota bacterium]
MTDQPATPDLPSQPPIPVPPPTPGNDFEPIESPLTLVTTFETLLKKPGRMARHLQDHSPSSLLLHLFVTTLICLTVFGFAAGSFSGGNQFWATPAKLIFGMFAAGLLCLPSLYIFSCLNGLDTRFRATAGTLFGILCLTSLLLLGFTPVIWIFSQSTESVFFMGALLLFFWLIAVHFGMGLLMKGASYLGIQRRGHLVIWGLIFVLVCLQMSTTLRPLIGESNEFLTMEKRFFLSHWLEEFRDLVD